MPGSELATKGDLLFRASGSPIRVRHFAGRVPGGLPFQPGGPMFTLEKTRRLRALFAVACAAALGCRGQLSTGAGPGGSAKGNGSGGSGANGSGSGGSGSGGSGSGGTSGMTG